LGDGRSCGLRKRFFDLLNQLWICAESASKVEF
jgi:hypothetical protein